MYKISVPVMNSNVTKENREAVLAELRRFDAERVFLAMDFYTLDKNKQKIFFDTLKDNCAFFKANGLEVYEDVAPISARFIANISRIKTKKNEFDTLLSALSVALIYTFLAVIAGLVLLGPAAKKYETL